MSNSFAMDCSQPSSSVCGISQAKILQWVAISFSGGSSQARDQTCFLQADSLPLSHKGSPNLAIADINSYIITHCCFTTVISHKQADYATHKNSSKRPACKEADEQRSVDEFYVPNGVWDSSCSLSQSRGLATERRNQSFKATGRDKKKSSKSLSLLKPI